ncbi:unnamed protein product [Sphagnum troendelagicum]|uniref:Cation/H+ exchanger domain-containing protein n=1 Tax=Sphagnum jensenii TaxID=128206 RepID=A0ABP0WGC8_9BRYO
MGLLFFLFMVGLELDLNQIRKTGRQALAIAAAGITLPFTAGVGVSFVLKQRIARDVKFGPFFVFMGVAMSITAFPVLARILAERKLLTTGVGQLAMSAAAVNDVVAWVLLALAVALSGSGKSPTIVLWVLLCGIAFVIFMIVAVRPVMTWIALHCLVIPKDGPFAGLLVEKLEDFVSILLLPLYFAISGLKTNVGSIHGATAGGLLVLVITVACLGKITGTFLAAKATNLTFNKSLPLGVLMNTKGLVELIVLNIGRSRGVLNEETFAIMVLMALFTTIITTPLVMALYKPAGNPIPYTRRKLDMQDDPKNDLRILSCVHGMKNVPTMINLMETTRGICKYCLRLYILHLMELSERTSAIMMVQRARRDARPFVNEANPDSRDQVVVAFEAYGQLSKVTVRPMTVISGFEDMHEDICTAAADKRVVIIILPFHKNQRLDGTFETTTPGFRNVNHKVL